MKIDFTDFFSLITFKLIDFLGNAVSIPMLRPFTKIKTDMQKMVQECIYSLGILIEPKEFKKFSNVEG